MDFAQRGSDSASALESYDCPVGSRLCGYIDAWSAKLHLMLSQEGRVLDHTRRAHELFLKAEAELKAIKEPVGVVENGLGNVYAQYLSNYSVLSRDFDWPDIEKPPRPFVNPSGGHPSFVAILNQALSHLAEGKRLESQKDADYARDRYENNLDDISVRLMILRHETYISVGQNGDPLAGAAAAMGDRIDAIRSEPIALIKKAKADLSRRLTGSDVAAVPVTIAQLGSLELDLESDSEVAKSVGASHSDSAESLTPVEAIQIALFMGFRDRGFFEHPYYMGMCPVVLSSDFGSRYAEIVREFLSIDSERLKKDCLFYKRNIHGRDRPTAEK